MRPSVQVEGGFDRKRKLALDVASFCAKELFPRHRAYDIYIDLAARDEFEGNDVGYCYGGEDDRDINIDVNADHPDLKDDVEFIDTICHEMVHAKQIITGQLKDWFKPKYVRKWLCKDGKYREYNNLPYKQLPWESEAYKISPKLTKKYLELYVNYRNLL